MLAFCPDCSSRRLEILGTKSERKKQIYSLFACPSELVILVQPQLMIVKESAAGLVSQLSWLKALMDVLLPACLLLSSDRHKHLSLCWAFVGTRSGCKKKKKKEKASSNARQTSVFQVTLRSVSVVSCWDPEEPAATFTARSSPVSGRDADETVAFTGEVL